MLELNMVSFTAVPDTAWGGVAGGVGSWWFPHTLMLQPGTERGGAQESISRLTGEWPPNHPQAPGCWANPAWSLRAPCWGQSLAASW